MPFFARSIAFAAALAAGLTLAPLTLAAQTIALARVPAAFAVRKDLGAPPRGVTELKFRDMFKLPVGPRGLEPSETLRALDGKRVRVVGYMVQQEPAPTASFLLSPLPTHISDEDEPLADDLPPSVLSVDVPGAEKKPIPWLPGLIRITGTLHVGAQTDAASGRVSSVQIALDAQPARALLATHASVTRAPAAAPHARAPNDSH